MKMNDFICSCFGIDDKVIDRLCDDFGVDLDEEDVFKAFSVIGDDRYFTTSAFFMEIGKKRLAIAEEFLYIIFEKIIDKYELDADKTDCDFSSPSYPDFYYNGVWFTTKEELEKLLEV